VLELLLPKKKSRRSKSNEREQDEAPYRLIDKEWLNERKKKLKIKKIEKGRL